MAYLIAATIVVVIAYFGWKWTARDAYESAQYNVLESEGLFEIREYPDLMLATTTMKFESQGDDGSFGRLFRYISGGNDTQQKVAMTTPVFMEAEDQEAEGQMAFVIPNEVATNTIPTPSSENVQIQKRIGGRFAVFRFAGRMNDEVRSTTEDELRSWLVAKGLEAEGSIEFAGYDPPWTPGPLRRNEILIRLK